MSQPQFQNGKDYGCYTIDTRFDVNGVLSSSVASSLAFFLNNFLNNGKGSVITDSLKFLVKTDVFSSAIETSVAIGFNDQKVSIGGVFLDFAGEQATEKMIQQILIVAFKSLLGASNLTPAGFVATVAVSTASNVIWSNIKTPP